MLISGWRIILAWALVEAIGELRLFPGGSTAKACWIGILLVFGNAIMQNSIEFPALSTFLCFTVAHAHLVWRQSIALCQVECSLVSNHGWQRCHKSYSHLCSVDKGLDSFAASQSQSLSVPHLGTVSSQLAAVSIHGVIS